VSWGWKMARVKYKKEAVLRYMRRNSGFRLGDVAVITDYPLFKLSRWMSEWERSGIVVKTNTARRIMEREYRYTGASV